MMVGLLWTQLSSAQVCPALQGTYKCGAKGTPKSLRLDIKKNGETYAFAAGTNQTFELVADNSIRNGNFGGPGKDVAYRANCLGGKLNVAFRMKSKGGQLLSANDFYYGERGGIVRVRVIQPESEVKGAPSVISCSPVFVGRSGEGLPADAVPGPNRRQEYQTPWHPPNPPAELNVPPLQELPPEDGVEDQQNGERPDDFFMENVRPFFRRWGP
jgi:hypothetical protein